MGRMEGYRFISVANFFSLFLFSGVFVVPKCLWPWKDERQARDS